MYDKRSKRKMGVETTRRNDRQYAFDRLLEIKSENLKQKIVLDDREELLKDANKIKRKVEKFAKIVNEKEIMSEKKEDEQNFAKKINQEEKHEVFKKPLKLSSLAVCKPTDNDIKDKKKSKLSYENATNLVDEQYR